MSPSEIKLLNFKLAKKKRDSRSFEKVLWLKEDIPKIVENREKSTLRKQKSRAAKKTTTNNLDNNSGENDKNNFYNNYEQQTDFNSCAVCAFESGLQDMVKITEKIKEYFISCGIQALYQERLEEYKLERCAAFVESLESETNEYGVLKYCNYICTKCYNTIRPKYKKQSKNNNNSKSIKTKKVSEANDDESDGSYSTIDEAEELVDSLTFDDLAEIIKYRAVISLQRLILYDTPEDERTPGNLAFLEKYSPLIENFINKTDKRIVANLIKQVDIINKNIMKKRNARK